MIQTRGFLGTGAMDGRWIGQKTTRQTVALLATPFETGFVVNVKNTRGYEMGIKYKHPITDRRSMAQYVSRCMGDSIGEFEVIELNQHSDTAWGVDRGNDWWVNFEDNKPDELRIVHRYSDKEAKAHLLAWVAYRTGGRVIGEDE